MIRILTKKKQVEILKPLVANSFMFEQKCDDIEWLDKYIENTIDIAEAIGGMDGVNIAFKLRKDLIKKVQE